MTASALMHSARREDMSMKKNDEKDAGDFDSAVYDLVRRIPRGRVSTYGEIAKKMGDLRYARAVGQALKRNRREDVPCHRVVRSDGDIGGYSRSADGRSAKERLLRKEGVEIVNGKVDLKKFLQVICVC